MTAVASLIGIDSAVDAGKVGLALAAPESSGLRLESAEVGQTETEVVKTLARWLRRSERALLAIDAPLGWPATLGTRLARHRAGEPLEAEANLIFRRATDRFIKSRIGKQPLDVGADRIARTALAALALLNRLRHELADPIPLAWAPHVLPRWSVIEVYPAATLRSHRIPAKGYRDPAGGEARAAILRRLQAHFDLKDFEAILEGNVDALDAAICAVAGVDFLTSTALPPDDIDLARSEGWIWARNPAVQCACQAHV